MTPTEEKTRQIYIITYKQRIEDGYPEKISRACAIMSKTGAEIMAKWKEQQMIDKACEWIKDMACYYCYSEYNPNPDNYVNAVFYDTEKLIKDFRKSMEGGEQ